MEAHQSTRLKTPSFVKTCLRQILRIRWPDTISNEEHNKDHFQRPSRSGNGGGLGTPYDQTQPASQDRHSTGTPKGSADKAVQPRLDTELLTYGISFVEAKHKAQDRNGCKTIVYAI